MPETSTALETLGRALAELTPAEHGFSYIDLDRPPAKEGDLTGWLIPAKDLHDVAGMPTTFGSKARTQMATSTDPFVAAYEARGAVIPGKSSTSELGLSVDAEPRDLPALDNPLYPGHTPGGSSGGAAVMVARGLVRAAHASDAGGSIRVPSAACGVVGFKPAGDGLVVQGYITTTVDDQALLHEIKPEYRKLKIGVLTTPIIEPVEVQQEWLDATYQAVEVLRGAGHEIVEVEGWPESQETFERFTDIFTSSMTSLTDVDYLAEWLRDRGLSVTPARLKESKEYSDNLKARMAKFWDVDVLIHPTLASDPPKIGAFTSLPPAENFHAQTLWTPWTSVWNMARAAAITVPWQLATRPQPAAVHLTALRISEGELLGLAKDLHE